MNLPNDSLKPTESSLCLKFKALWLGGLLQALVATRSRIIECTGRRKNQKRKRGQKEKKGTGYFFSVQVAP
jgi:hypothetical protein